MEKRPNILFLMSDEHRADVAGFAGNKVVQTPILNHLAETGVVFNNAYTPSPVCVPGRQCLMAGQLPKTCGCEGWVDLKSGYRTFAQQFSRYAYNTVCSGKLHHQGPDQMQGWRQRLSPDAELDDWAVEGAIKEEFEKYTPALGTGKWSNQREIEEARAAYGPYQDFDARATDAALGFMDRYFKDILYRRPQNHRPLLFKLSLLQPHYPYFTDSERFEYYHDRISVYNDPLSDHPVLSQSQQWEPVNASEDARRRATAVYYGMVDQIDTYYGLLLEKLESLGENLDDWIIVYTSDHGEMLGQHGIWEKTRFYEGSAKVPLIIRWPKQFKPRVVNENINLCDLYATLCDLAGLETPRGLDSRSLVPLLNGNSDGWSNETISQMNDDNVMIKQDALKYQYYGPKYPEVLFNLEKDPGEDTNVSDSPEYAEAMAAFRNRLSELGHGPNAVKDYQNAGYCSS